MLTRKEIMALVVLSIGNFPDMENKNAGTIVNAWEASLPEKFVFDIAKAAIMRVIQTSEFFPRVSRIVEAYQEIETELKGSDYPTDADAWREVLLLIQDVGQYRGEPAFSHPMIGLTVKGFGWYELCVSENGGIDRAQFMRMYNTNVARDKSNERAKETLQLLGSNATIQKALNIGKGGDKNEPSRDTL